MATQTERPSSPPIQSITSVGRLLIAVIGLTCAVLLTSQLAGSASSSAPIEATGPGAGPDTLGAIETKSAVYDLVFDRERGRLWYAVFQTAEADYLYWADVRTRAGGSVELPNVDTNGFTSQIEVAGDGAVWVTEPYALIRYWPDDGTLDVLTFQQPGSAEDGAAGLLPGTWISAIGVDGDNVVVSRNNIAYVEWVDPKLRLGRRMTVDVDHSGARSSAVVGSQIYLTAGYTSSAAVEALDLTDGSVRGASTSATHLERMAAGVLASGSGVVYRLPGIERVDALTGGDEIAVATDSGDLVGISALEALVELVRPDGKIGWSIPLPTISSTVTNPLGQEVTIQAAHQLLALAVDDAGHVWYSDGSTLQIVELGP